MPYHSVSLGQAIPTADTRVQICHDLAKTVVWLQLTMPDGNTEQGRPTYSMHLIGAVHTDAGWTAIHAGMADRNRQVTLSYGTRLCDQKMQSRQQWITDRFQRAILANWRTFDGAHAERWAKGTTLGADLSSPSFVMKALKTGFDAIGAAVHAYDGLRYKGFTVDEVIAYIERRTGNFINVAERGLHDFKEVAPLIVDERDQADTLDRRPIPYIPSRKPHGGRFTYGEVDLAVPFPRVIGYGFRGEKRAPGEVRDAAGFWPNYTRPEHEQRAMAGNNFEALNTNALNLPDFLNDQFFGGFISTSRSVLVSKGFATNMGSTTDGPRRHAGWIYACFLEGAFQIPPRGVIPKLGNRPQIDIRKEELELAFPGMLDWEDIVACRWVDQQGYFDGNIFMRETLEQEDPEAAGQILRLLSGQSQDL